MTTRDTAEAALAALREMADDAVLRKVDAGLAAGTGRMIPDPEVDGVWGYEEGGKVRVIIYLPSWMRERPDFECDDAWVWGE